MYYRKVPVKRPTYQEQLTEVSRPPLLPEKIWRQEIANSCGAPKKWQLIDAMGSIMGLFLWVDGAKRIQRNHKDRWALGELSLATLMVYIHTPRFFYSKEEFCKEIEPYDNRWA